MLEKVTCTLFSTTSSLFETHSLHLTNEKILIPFWKITLTYTIWHGSKDIIFSAFDRIFLETIIAFFRSGNFEAVRRACPGPLGKLLRSRTKPHC
jgi:hypothetical protein